MMVLLGGKERTLDELRELAHEVGLDVLSVHRHRSRRIIVECRPA